MQTFLPYSSFEKSASVLDNKRLGKQRVEAKQIYLALTKKNYGWKNHPAVKMWKGNEEWLLKYGISICEEWIDRGFKDSLLEWFRMEFAICHKSLGYPNWLDNELLHSSHRSALLAKNPEHYGELGWTEEPMDLTFKPLPYYWPV